MATGLAAQGIPHNERIHHLMMTHRTLGLVIGPLALLLTGWSFWHKAQQPNIRYGFLLTLAVVTGLVTQTADIGARMVFVEGAAVKPAVSVIAGGAEEAQPHSHGATEEDAHTHHH
jgi:heme A synthase